MQYVSFQFTEFIFVSYEMGDHILGKACFCRACLLDVLGSLAIFVCLPMHSCEYENSIVGRGCIDGGFI